VLHGLGDDRFEPVPGSPFSVAGATEVATGDLDGDGVADVAIGPWDGQDVVVLLGGTFARRAVTTARRPVGLAIADLDGDGRAELIAASLIDDVVVVMSPPQ
jgi:FG-GAP-like repeat